MMTPLNIAHRGGAQLWPENTLFAFVSAARAGYDGAELDVQLTRDDRLVVFHDFHLKPGLCRTTGGDWLRRRLKPPPLIRELSLAELSQFEVGRPKPGTLYARRHRRMIARDGEPIPTLAAVIAAVRAVKPAFRLFIEIKAQRGLSAAPEAIAEAAIAELQAAEFFGNAILVGFDWAGLIHAKKRKPDLTCWFSTDTRSRLDAEPIAAAGGDGWFCAANRASPRAVQKARAHALAFGVWTVNDARDMQALIAQGVDAICTDRPDKLQTFLGRVGDGGAAQGTRHRPLTPTARGSDSSAVANCPSTPRGGEGD